MYFKAKIKASCHMQQSNLVFELYWKDLLSISFRSAIKNIIFLQQSFSVHCLHGRQWSFRLKHKPPGNITERRWAGSRAGITKPARQPLCSFHPSSAAVWTHYQIYLIFRAPRRSVQSLLFDEAKCEREHEGQTGQHRLHPMRICAIFSGSTGISSTCFD